MVGWGVYGRVNRELFGFGLVVLGEFMWLFVHDAYCICIPVCVGCPRFYTKARLLICKNFDV